MSRTTAVLVFAVLANAVAVVCAFGPWTEAWSEAGVLFLILEAVFLIVVGVPVFLHHSVRRGKSLRRSLVDTLDSVLGFLAGWI